MPAPEPLSAEAFAVEALRAEPDLEYPLLRQRAETLGISLHPIHYGRARKQLGLPPLRDARPAPTAAAAPAPLAAVDATPADAADSTTAAPRRKGSAAFDFVVDELRKDPTLLYAELRNRCMQRGFPVAPIMYGRAKALLGLVPVKPRTKKAPAGQAPDQPPRSSPPPLQLRQVESVAADKFARKLDDVRNLDQLVAMVKELDAERRRLRAVIERVIDLLDEALG